MTTGKGADLAARLAGTRFGPVRWVEETTSTNTELLDAARAGEAEGAVLVAESQSAGHGRKGRAWLADPGSSLLMSVLLRPGPALGAEHAHLTTTAFVVSAVDAIAELSPVPVGIKWPNDVVIDAPPGAQGPGYLKIAGVLAESLLEGGRVSAIVIGVGVNTGWRAIPDELLDRAASLNLLSGEMVDRVALAARIIRGFEEQYEPLLAGGEHEVLERARERSATLGRRVRVQLDAESGLTEDGTVEGDAVALDELGRLVVRRAAGDLVTLDLGDVEHLRPLAPRGR